MRRVWFLGLIAALSLLGNSSFVKAQERAFPNRTIEIIVPMAAGGVFDITTRLIEDQLGKELKIPVAVINKPGATGVTGSALVAKAKPDGHTLLCGGFATMIVVYFFQDSVPYDAQKDFSPLAFIGESPSVFLVKTSSPWKTFKELIDYAKANPGKVFHSGMLSSTNTMNLTLIKSQTGANIENVLYEGGGQSIIALLGGHVQTSSITYSAARSQILAGELRPLAATKKITELPDVPTWAELGFPNTLTNWLAFFAPAKIPKEVHEKLVSAFDKVLKNPDVIERFKKVDIFPQNKTPAEISEVIRNDYNLVSRIFKEKKLITK